MQLCLNTLMWHDRPLAEALAAARSFGIPLLDLAATAAHPHLPVAEGAGGAEELRPLLRDWTIAALTADHPGFPRLPEDGGRAAVTHTVAAVRCAAALGAPVVGVSLGRTDVDAWESAWNRALGALRQVLRETSETGVRLAVELHVDDVLDSLRKARRLLAEIPDPRLGLTLDTSLLHYRRIQLRDALEVAGERLLHVHLRDAVRDDFYRSIGRGEVRFAAVFRALREHGYTGALSIELYETSSRHGLTVEQALEEAVPKLREWLGC